ncbi:hypothetical protein ACIQBJ_08660 [Kitasatospora sp. NPDC088391]|uniref:hypothetical protein n=1 Tax=Kitasatospora sp. NPDC088391 TaxID=3364074 RepID=UPI003811BCD0
MDLTLTEQRLVGLARTLTRVRADSPYYRGLIPDGVITPAQAPAVLRRLPVLDAAAWSEVRHDLRTSDFEGIVTGFTNGTSGLPKVFYSTRAERAAMEASLPRSGGRRLHLAGLSHGAVVGAGVVDGEDFVPLLSMSYFDLAAEMIAGGAADGTRVRVLAVSSVQHLKILTLRMKRRFGDLAAFGIETIEVRRQFLSPEWDIRLREWWGADIEVVYGFSELRMCNARKCRSCGHHHFPPSCTAEVVDPADPDTYTPLGGRGTLLVTAFHPYVEFEPRLRYRPGDLVELARKPCPERGEPGFLPLGREADCISLGTPGRYLTPADCVPALADTPHIALGFHHGHADEPEAGSPRFRLADGPAGRALHVELRFDPIVWPGEARAVAESVARKLPADVSVVLHAPGQLENPTLV